jgi:hypothetical protein
VIGLAAVGLGVLVVRRVLIPHTGLP